MKKAAIILSEESRRIIYAEPEIRQIRERVELLEPFLTPQNAGGYRDQLGDVEVIFSGWGAPKLDAAFLEMVPSLKVFLYGAGSVKGFVTDEFWGRGILLSSAYAANAVPVCEFAFAQIILALKSVLQQARMVEEKRDYPWKEKKIASHGSFGTTVGLVSLGMIGKMVAERLKSLDVEVIAYDPFVGEEQAAELGVKMVGLEELFANSQVVSLHTPWLKETENMVTEKLLRSMRPYASIINTSRGAVIDEDALVRVLSERRDLAALLDVTHPEPPAKDSKLYDLPNVSITPHLAGSHGQECRRMGQAMIAELDRYLSGEPLKWRLDEHQVKIMA